MSVLLSELTIDQLHDAILNGEYAEDEVFQYVLGYNDHLYANAKREKRVLSELKEELNYMTFHDFDKLVSDLNLPVTLIAG